MRRAVLMLSLVGVVAMATSVQAQPGGGGGRGRGGFGMFGRGGGGIFMLVRNEAVQKELSLSTDAADKVKAVVAEFDAAAGERPNFRDMSQQERAQAFAKMQETSKANTEKFLPKLKEALTADQFTRLQQINWQAMGTAAYSDPEVVKALPVTAEQQDKIKTINSTYDAKQEEARQGGFNEETRDKMQQISQERDAKLKETLTADQLNKFAMLTGKEFDLSQLRPQGRGQGGGGGGGGGGGRGKRPQPKAE